MRLAADEAAPQTMTGYGELALRKLCTAAGLGDLETKAVNGYRIMTESWGDRTLEEPPPWSILTADSTPAEYSVILHDEPVAVRVGIEALSDQPSPESYWANAKKMTERLAKTYNLHTEHLKRIEHLFAPHPSARRSMVALHVMGWSRSKQPEGKIYLCVPNAEVSASSAIYDEALTLLGFPGQWRRIADALHADDVVPYFSLDLTDDSSARAKVYVQHKGKLTAGRLEALDRLATNPFSSAGPVLARIANAAEDRSVWSSDVPTDARLQWLSHRRRHWSANTYVALVHERSRPIDTVMHQFALPTRCRDDGEADRMVLDVLDAFRVSEQGRAAYQRCVAEFVGPELSQERYHLTYVSAHQEVGELPRIGVYLNPRMFQPRWGLTNGDLERAWRFQGLSG